ncbi:MAG TPA: hypothetical protein VF517_10630 [Thermoleophilaceae bacterium]
MIWSNRIRTLLAALVVGLAVLPAASASADRAYSLRYGQVERGDITTAANTIVTCPEGAPNCANARNGTGTVLRNSAWVMVPIDIDSDSTTFDSSSADLRLPAGATILYAGLYWGSDTKAMPEGVDAPNPAARGTMRLAAPDGAGYRTITASTVDSDRFFPSRYQGFADVTSLVRQAGAGTYTAANVQASTGKDQYGGWGLVVAYRDPSKPVRWLGLYDGYRDFGGDDAADVPITGFRTPPSGTVDADFGMLAYEGDLGVQPDTARINGRDLVDPLHALNNYWNASITEYGSHVTTRNPSYINTLGMDANIMGIDGFLVNDATSAILHMEVATDLVMPGAMTLVSDQAASAPANTAAPTVSGTARDGQTLTAGNGTWSGTTPMTFSYQWRRCDSAGAACVDIDGATGSTYVVGAGDVGKTIRVQVTARNVVSSGVASSGATGVVVARAPVNNAPPVVSGTARDGQALSTTNGSWTGTPTISFAYQWRRCDSAGNACVDIAGATGSSYTLVPADVGKTIRVVVTASNAGGTAASTSDATGAVTARPPANGAPPVVSGTARDGQSLTTTTGSWTGTPTISFAYQWQRCDSGGDACVDIAGATGSSYTLVPADVGKTLRAEVTASNAGGSAASTSDPTGTVTARPPANSAPPVVSGTARDGQALSTTNGSWTGTPTISFGYQWRRCDSAGGSCVDIAGATGSSYTLVPADVGKTIRVVVTASNAGGSAAATSDATGAVAARAPVNNAPPVVSGTARDGQSLTTTTGSWTGTPTIAFAYQWRRCDSAGDVCTDIAGATGSSYALVPADVGKTIRVVVTASNAGGSATSTSDPTGTVAARAPVNNAPPVVSGTARDGQSLTTTNGSWSGTPTISFGYQWRRCDSAGGSCVDIAGATGSTYALVPADVGKTLRAEVTGTNGGGSASAVSAPSAVVAARPPTNNAPPVISGTARDGQTLSTTNGSWTGTPTISFTYQWRRCDSAGNTCVDIAGATGSSYALVPADVGKTLRAVVTASNAGGSAASTSDATGAVAARAPVNNAAPVVSGTARDGQSLTTTNGSWTGTPTISFGYQWQRCDSGGDACVDIAGATGTSYTLVPADVGKTLRAEVTASNAGGSAASTSDPTGTVTARPPANNAPPVVSGTARDGQSLTATTGSWTGTPTITFAYQWRRCDSAGNGCASISGATGAAYELTPADVGHAIRVVVTATNAGGSAASTSDPTGAVTASPPVNTAPPVVSGNARDSQTLTTTTGSWTGTPTISFAYQWRRCDSAGNGCANISGATGASYELTPVDVGHAIRVVVTATNAGGSAALTSDPTGAVGVGPPLNSTLPKISGTARDGLTLTADDGSWTGTPTITYTRRWRRCDAGGNDCANIVGATGTTYTLTASDVGATIRVLVTAANGGGERSAESAPTAVVQAIPPANTTAPTLTGTAREGEELALSDGSWTGSAPLTFTYAWERCGVDGSGCVPIAGATAASYTLVLADVGARVRGVVTAANAGGSRSAATDPTAVVTAKPVPPPPPPADSGGTTPGGSTGGTTPGGSTPGTTEPGTTPAGSTPGGSTPGGSTPGTEPGTTPGGTTPDCGSTTGGSTTSGSTTPGGSTTGGSGTTSGDCGTAPSAALGASQWKSSTGTGLRLRVDSDEPIKTLAFTAPRAMLPQRGDAGRVAGRITVYRKGAKSRTWTVRVTRAGGLATRGASAPRLALGRGTLRVSGLPAGAVSVKLTLYTRNATSPKALVKPGHAARLDASLRTTAGRLEHLTYRLGRRTDRHS